MSTCNFRQTLGETREISSFMKYHIWNNTKRSKQRNSVSTNVSKNSHFRWREEQWSHPSKSILVESAQGSSFRPSLFSIRVSPVAHGMCHRALFSVPSTVLLLTTSSVAVLTEHIPPIAGILFVDSFNDPYSAIFKRPSMSSILI